LSGADDYNLSQIISYDDVDIWSFEPLAQIALHRSALRTAEAILVPKIEHLTASILKNPFTMSNTTGVPVNHRTLVRRTVSLHQPGYVVSVSPKARAPSVAAKLRLVALAGLGEVRGSYAASSLRLRLGGAYRDRTDDLMLAKQPLSQLS
jgi:hypothetical protein